MPLYLEALHILVRPHLNLSSLAELRDKKVWLGAPNSGTEFTAKRVLEGVGLTKAEVRELEKSSRELEKDGRKLGELRFCDVVRMLTTWAVDESDKPIPELDALFRVTVVPNHDIEDVLKEDAAPPEGEQQCAYAAEVQLFGLDYSLVKRLASDGSFIETLLPANDYGQERATLTVAVQALLLTNKPVEDSKDSDVSRLAQVLREKRSEIEDEIRVQVKEHHGHRNKPTRAAIIGKVGQPFERLTELFWGPKPVLNLLEVEAQGRLADRFHPGAKNYRYQPWKVFSMQTIPAIGLPLLALVALFRWKRAGAGRWLVVHAHLALAGAGTLVIWFLGALVLNYFESRVNEHFSSVHRSLQYTLLYLMSFRGFSAVTPDGQWAVEITRWVSLVLFGGFATPVIRDWLRAVGPRLMNWLLGRRPVPRTLKDHIVMLNRSPRTDNWIKEWHAPAKKSKRPIVVVTQKREVFPAKAEYGRIVSVVGDPNSVDCLREVRVAQAHSVAITSAWPPASPDRRKWLRGDEADVKTILAIRTIRELCSEQTPPPTVPITAEIRARQNFAEAERVGGSQTRIVCV